jgi:hypothetical protein
MDNSLKTGAAYFVVVTDLLQLAVWMAKSGSAELRLAEKTDD